MLKVVMGLSGGMDSATLLGSLVQQRAEVHCCTFYYASKHNVYENKAAKDLVDFYVALGKPVFHHFVNVEEAFKGFKSNLLLDGGEIPEGHYEEESMRQTVVPGRNLIFAHKGDHHIYPDCRKEFIKSLDTTVYLSSDRKVSVIAPFIDMDKTEILSHGLHIQVPAPIPYHLTRTCYKDQEVSCGKCGSCQERLEAFKLNGIVDPIKYENE
jgi:7-cyano-7-deazaguanine synthase